MILRVLALGAGLAGGATTSQFPEFSQQYMQRLGGAVDALEQVVNDFDASAQTMGMTRAQALSQMTGSPFIERRQADMTATFARYEALSTALERLEGAGPFERALHLPQMQDAQVARATWQAFQPAVPLTFAGVIFALGGFLLAALGVGLILRLLSWPFRQSAKA